MADGNYRCVKNAVLNNIAEGWLNTEHDALMYIHGYCPSFTVDDFVTLVEELKKDGKLY